MTVAFLTTLFARSLAVVCSFLATFRPRICRFWRSRNLPPFHDLRSDYPLTFTSFRWLDMGPFKYRSRAVVSRADSVNCRSLIGGKVRSVSWSLAHAVLHVQVMSRIAT